MDLNQITPLILTFNESANIARTLASLRWAPRIVVLDSESTDNTIDLAGTFPNVGVHHRPFDTHSAQWNHGLTLVQTDWVLAFDADYIADERFADELRALVGDPTTSAYYAEFIYCVFGRELHASLYPPRAVLFRRNTAHFIQDGHTQLLQFVGGAGRIESRICHDDRKPLSHWLRSQDCYAQLEAEKLQASGNAQLGVGDTVRKWIIPAAPLVFFHCLLFKGLLFQGWAGWYYTFQRTLAELILSLRLIERKLQPRLPVIDGDRQSGGMHSEPIRACEAVTPALANKDRPAQS